MRRYAGKTVVIADICKVQIIAIMTHILELLQQIFAPDGVMMAITPLIGAGVSLASSIGNAIFGGISANKQEREQLKAIRKQQRENRDWYNRRYNEDSTQRADVQRMLSRTNEAIKARNRAAAGKQKVIGGTDASLASTQQANAAAVGDAISEVAAKAEARKDNIEAQYRERKADLDAQEDAVKANAEAAKRNATAQAATGAVNAGASLIAAAGDGGTNKRKPDVTSNPPGGAAILADQGAKKAAKSLVPTLDDNIRNYPSLEDYWNRVNK